MGQSWNIQSVSPSEAIVWNWDGVLISLLQTRLTSPPMGDSLICHPELLWLCPIELSPSEGTDGLFEPEPEARLPEEPGNWHRLSSLTLE